MKEIINKKRIRAWTVNEIDPIKRRLARIMAQVERGTMNPSQARLLVQGAAVLINAVKVEKEFDMEKRFEAIEQKLEVTDGAQ